MIKLLATILLIFLLVFNIGMTLPAKVDLETMDYAYQAQPFVEVPAKGGIDLETMDYAYQAQPFVGGIAGWAHKWNTQNITKWNGQVIRKWNGLE